MGRDARKPRLALIGAGMGNPNLLSVHAADEIRAAGRLYAFGRLAGGIAALNPHVRVVTISALKKELSETISDTAVIVSGDAGFFSYSKTLTAEFSDHYEIEIIGGQNSLQYLCGRLAIPYDDVRAVSLHGRSGNLVAAVSYHRHVFALVGGENTAKAAIEALCAAGMGFVRVTVGEKLSYPGERIAAAAASELRGQSFDDLAVLLIENDRAANPRIRLRDADFLRGDPPMTKECIRELAVARLAPEPGATVWDIGAGTGSVSIALAYAACEGTVCALEKSEQAVTVLLENRVKFGAHNIDVVTGEAPERLHELPAPDCVFVGGSSGNLRQILEIIREKSTCCRVLVTAVTLETIAECARCISDLGYIDVETICVNVSEAKQMGDYHMMMAQNPVYLFSGVTRHD